MNDLINILVVEDDEDDFFLLERNLKTTILKTNIIWATNFEKAKQLLKSQNFDIVLLDYRLGAHTGIEVLTYINEIFSVLPTILLTGIKRQAIDDEALKSGAFDYLVKDECLPENLERSIRYAIERARVLSSLKESENKYRALFEYAIEYILILNSEYRIQDVNKAALKLFDCDTKDKLINQRISDLFTAEFFAQTLKPLFDNKLELINISQEIEITILKTNKKYWCLFNLTLVDPEKNYVQIVLHDITDKKINEQKEKILEKQLLTGKVARVIAHEIKNPLTNIQLSLSELRYLHDKKGEEKDSAKELFDIVDRNSKRINKLIEDLLNATRFDSMEFVPVELDQLINETLDLVNDRIRFKEIVIEKAIQKNIQIKADKEKLIIALINIIVNSIEAMEEKGGKIEIGSFGDEKSVCIQVKDNGKGIHPDHLLKLFEPFFTSKKGGTGLGLSAAYNIITKHDGNIRAESKLGEGTVFSIILPLI